MKWILVCCLVVLVVGQCQTYLVEDECCHGYYEHKCRATPKVCEEEEYCNGASPYCDPRDRRREGAYYRRDIPQRTRTPEPYEIEKTVVCRMGSMCDIPEDTVETKERVEPVRETVPEKKEERHSVLSGLTSIVQTIGLIIAWSFNAVLVILGAFVAAGVLVLVVFGNFIGSQFVWALTLFYILYNLGCAIFSMLESVFKSARRVAVNYSSSTGVVQSQQSPAQTCTPQKIEEEPAPEEEVESEDDEPSAPELQETEEERLIRIQGLIASWPQ